VIVPAAKRWMEQYQPFTPLIETQRAPLLCNDPGSSLWQAVVWFGDILVVGSFSATSFSQKA
jgi:ABC-type polysaccharide/polyol phosphate export permease